MPSKEGVVEIRDVDDWIAGVISPGDLHILKHPRGPAHHPNEVVAILACPRCGVAGFITRSQYDGDATMLCASDTCSAWFMASPRGTILLAPC
jgi:hypothetical protein